MEAGDEKEAFSIEVQPKKKGGYFVRKRTAAILIVAAIIAIVLVGVLAAYLGPGRGRKGRR